MNQDLAKSVQNIWYLLRCILISSSLSYGEIPLIGFCPEEKDQENKEEDNGVEVSDNFAESEEKATLWKIGMK